MAKATIRTGVTMGNKVGTIIAGLIFAVCFGAVGAGATWVIATTVADGLAAREWVKVRAEVLSFQNDSVRYRYEVDGRKYTGDRMGTFVMGGRDNIDSWHGEMSQRLSAAVHDKKPITVFVDPSDPSRSMIDNTIRWNLLAMALPFALGFGGVGVGALFFMVKSLLPSRPKAQPTRPSRGLAARWFFTFMWNVISVPIAYIAVPQLWAEGEWMGLLILLFPLIGALLLWGAITSTLAAIRDVIRDAFRRPATPDLFQQAAAAAAAPLPAQPQPAEAGGTVFARGMLSDTPTVATAAPHASGLRDFPTAEEPRVSELCT
jgi:hypothetical protein